MGQTQAKYKDREQQVQSQISLQSYMENPELGRIQ